MEDKQEFTRQLEALREAAPAEKARLESEREALNERIEFLTKLCGNGRAKRDSKPAPPQDVVRETIQTVRSDKPSASAAVLEAEAKERLKAGGYRITGIHRSIRSILAESTASEG